MRIRNPNDNSEMGVISLPSDQANQGDLIDFDPDASRAQKFAFGRNGDEGTPFEISPVCQISKVLRQLMR
jgi:hypothetical protein